MSELHHTRHDPETGCAMLFILGVAILVVVLAFLAGFVVRGLVG